MAKGCYLTILSLLLLKRAISLLAGEAGRLRSATWGRSGPFLRLGRASGGRSGPEARHLLFLSLAILAISSA